MDITYIEDHKVKPQFTAGKNYEAVIEEVVDKDSGFTMELSFPELGVPAYWHFNVANESEKAKQIADDELKGLIEQIGEPIADSKDLEGRNILVRLTTAPDSNLPNVGLPIASKKGNRLAI